MSSEGRVKINSPPSHIHPSLQRKANILCPINHSPSPQDGVIPMILNLATVKSFLLNPKELLFKYQHTKKKKKKQKLKNTHTHTHTQRNKCCWPSCRAWGWAWSCPPPEPWGSFHWGGPWGAPPAPGCVPRSAAPGSHSGTATHPHTHAAEQTGATTCPMSCAA